MKKLLCILAIAMAFTGCARTDRVATSDNSTAYVLDGVTEHCYKGVTYLVYAHGATYSWGSVRIGVDGKVVTCGGANGGR